MSAWKLKFAWTPKQVRSDRRIWLRLYYEKTENGAIYRREKGQSRLYKINVASMPY